MKKQEIDRRFAPKGYHAKAYTGCSDCAFYDEHARNMTSRDPEDGIEYSGHWEVTKS